MNNFHSVKRYKHQYMPNEHINKAQKRKYLNTLEIKTYFLHILNSSTIIQRI